MRVPVPAPYWFAALLAGCGGGGDGGSAMPAPAPAPSPAKVTLAPTNYQDAVRLPMQVSSSAYLYAKLGIDVVDRWLNVPLPPLPLIACPGGGTVRIELTDRNADRTLDPLDTLHFQWDRCRVQDTTTTGVVRVELREATAPAGGRDYLLTVTVGDLRMERDGQSATTVNFVTQVHYAHGDTFDRIELSNAVFDSGQIIGDTGTATLDVEYRQDGAAQSYQYSLSGTASSGKLGGEVQFSTPAPFSGVIGEYPSAGRLLVTGSTGSGARLAEEGVAAADVATARAEVDSNGDGSAEASDERLAWVSVVPAQLFAAFMSQRPSDVPVP